LTVKYIILNSDDQIFHLPAGNELYVLPGAVVVRLYRSARSAGQPVPVGGEHFALAHNAKVRVINQEK